MQAVADDAAQPALAWTGRGQEPFWTLRIADHETELRQPGAGYEKTADDVKIDEAADGAVTAVFLSNGVPFLTATRTNRLCIDGATGAPLPYAMAVQSGEQSFEGCGGSTEEFLSETPWVIEDINKRGVVDHAEPRIAFGTDGSVNMRAGCVELRGSYGVNGGELSLELAPDPMQVCEIPALARQEAILVEIAGSPLQIGATTWGEIRLTSGKGEVLTLRR